MLCQLRIAPLTHKFSALRVGALALIAGLAGQGCSADIMRFDAPALGLGSTAANQAPPPPIHSDGSLFDQRPSARGAAPAPPAPPVASAPVERSPLAATAPRAHEPERWSRQPRTRNPQSYAAADPTPRSGFEPQTSPPTSRVSGTRLTVERGDTLYTLARRHGVSVQTLKRANGLTSDVIQPGQILYLEASGASPPAAARRLPPARNDQLAGSAETYTVQPGDSLYAISRQTGVSVHELKRRNGIDNARRIRPGLVLNLGRRGEQRGQPVDREPPVTRRYADARIASQSGLSRVRRLSDATPSAPIILNPKPEQRVTEPGGGLAAGEPRQQTALHQPASETRPQPSDPAADRQVKFRWPVRGRIIRGFGKRADGSNNDGINIAVPVGASIHAAEAGTVAYAGNELKGYGNLILVRHANGYVTAYAHSSQMLVRRGDDVRRGQIIAKAGKTGTVRQPQLHFELRKGAKPVDPMPFLGRM